MEQPGGLTVDVGGWLVGSADEGGGSSVQLVVGLLIARTRRAVGDHEPVPVVQGILGELSQSKVDLTETLAES